MFSLDLIHSIITIEIVMADEFVKLTCLNLLINVMLYFANIYSVSDSASFLCCALVQGCPNFLGRKGQKKELIYISHLNNLHK